MTTTLLRLPDVIRATGLSRSAIYRLEARGEFPARVRVSTRATAWRSDAVIAWIDSRPRAVAHQSSAT
jgi:prophage regulatory protein